MSTLRDICSSLVRKHRSLVRFHETGTRTGEWRIDARFESPTGYEGLQLVIEGWYDDLDTVFAGWGNHAGPFEMHGHPAFKCKIDEVRTLLTSTPGDQLAWYQRREAEAMLAEANEFKSDLRVVS